MCLQYHLRTQDEVLAAAVACPVQTARTYNMAVDFDLTRPFELTQETIVSNPARQRRRQPDASAIAASGRIYSGFELADTSERPQKVRKQRGCGLCKKPGHDYRTCPDFRRG